MSKRSYSSSPPSPVQRSPTSSSRPPGRHWHHRFGGRHWHHRPPGRHWHHRFGREGARVGQAVQAVQAEPPRLCRAPAAPAQAEAHPVATGRAVGLAPAGPRQVAAHRARLPRADAMALAAQGEPPRPAGPVACRAPAVRMPALAANRRARVARRPGPPAGPPAAAVARTAVPAAARLARAAVPARSLILVREPEDSQKSASLPCVRSLGYDDDGCDATQASVVNDDYTDGHPFMRGHSGVLLMVRVATSTS